MLRKIPVLLLCICTLFASAEIINVSSNQTSIVLYEANENSIHMTAELGDLLLENKEISNQNVAASAATEYILYLTGFVSRGVRMCVNFFLIKNTKKSSILFSLYAFI